MVVSAKTVSAKPVVYCIPSAATRTSGLFLFSHGLAHIHMSIEVTKTHQLLVLHTATYVVVGSALRSREK